jgi:hypothetical protein
MGLESIMTAMHVKSHMVGCCSILWFAFTPSFEHCQIRICSSLIRQLCNLFGILFGNARETVVGLVLVRILRNSWSAMTKKHDLEADLFLLANLINVA